MGAAYFYHLTNSTVEQALTALLPRALAAGWRVAVRGCSQQRLEALDAQLWMQPEDGFLPHGMAGGPHDALQPVLLTTSAQAANTPTCVMSVEGAAVEADEIMALERVCVLFDGHDEAALTRARQQWKHLSDAGCALQYWSQAEGPWRKMHERAGDASSGG